MKLSRWLFRLLVLPGALSVSALAQAPAGTVYTESNIGDVAGKNSILAFTRSATGVLTQFGEYKTRGTGVHPVSPEPTVATLATTLGPFDSDQNLLLTPDAKTLFAVNSGSDTVAMFRVKSDGSLVAVPGSPFRCYGKNPVSLGLAEGGKVLIVANKDYDLGRPGFNISRRQPSYTAFRISANGLSVRSTVVAGHGGQLGPGYTNPTQALIVPGGEQMFDVDFFGYSIRSFSIDTAGKLRRESSELMPVSALQSFPPLASVRALPIPLGMAAHPTLPLIYVGLVFDASAALFYYGQDGEMEFLRSVAVGNGPCWIRVNAAGTRMYTSNTLANSVSTLDITDPFNPVKLQEFTLTSPPDLANGASPFGINLDPSGQFLYCITIKALGPQSIHANALHVLKLASDGTVDSETDRHEIAVLPSAPQGIASH